MSITPVEEDENGGTREPSRAAHPGVRARLRSWLASVSERVRSAFSRSPSDSNAQRTPDTDRSGQIRVGGQRRLTGSHESADDHDDALPARVGLPGRIAITTEQDDGTLRVFDPDSDEAFIASDTWEDIER